MTVDGNPSPERKPGDPSGPLLPILNQPSTRRTALKVAGAALGLAAFGKAVSPLWSIPENVSVDEFLQQHYKELTNDENTTVSLSQEDLDNYEKALEAIYSKAKQPDEVAELVLAAIVEGHFWIQTDGFYRDAIRARHRSIENDTPPPARGTVISVYDV